MSHNTLLIISSIVMVLGIPAVFIPMLPGISYMFLVAIVFGILDHFIHLTLQNILILATILVVSFFVDYFAGVLGAKYGGADRRSVLYGFLGLILGVLILPPFGGIVGLFVGILLGEYHAKRSGTQALRAATASLIGSFTGSLINICLAITFFVSFILFAWK